MDISTKHLEISFYVSTNDKEILHVFCDEMLVHVNSRLSKFILTSSAALKNTFKSIKVDQ